MKNKIEKCKAINSQRVASGNANCFSVSLEALKVSQKEHQKLELAKKNMAQKKHQGTANCSAESGLKASSIFRGKENYGACAIVGGSPNSFSSSGFTPCDSFKTCQGYRR